MSGPEVISFDKYFGARMDDLEKRFAQRLLDFERRLDTIFEFQKVALEKAETRSELERSRFDMHMEKIELSIKSLEISKATLEGKASEKSVILSLLLAFLAIVVSVGNVLVRFIK